MTTTTRKTAPLETTSRTVLTEEGSIWGVRLSASCYLAAAGIRQAPAPMVQASITMFGKHVDMLKELKEELLDDDWADHVKDAVAGCTGPFTDRGVVLPDQFREELLVAMTEARKQAIMSVVRHQAASLIRELSSEEACRIWSEEEARHIFES